jgi:hypothetical protein
MHISSSSPGSPSNHCLTLKLATGALFSLSAASTVPLSTVSLPPHHLSDSLLLGYRLQPRLRRCWLRRCACALSSLWGRPTGRFPTTSVVLTTCSPPSSDIKISRPVQYSGLSFRHHATRASEASYEFLSLETIVAVSEIGLYRIPRYRWSGQPYALGGPRVVQARALQGSGGLDNSSQPRIRLFLVEFLFALRAIHTSILQKKIPNFRILIIKNRIFATFRTWADHCSPSFCGPPGATVWFGPRL